MLLDTSGELAAPGAGGRARTSCPTPGSRPTAGAWPGSSGRTPTCRGTAPSCASPTCGRPPSARRWPTLAVVAGRPHARVRAGTGDGESVTQPRWAADGSLWFVSDRTGWWNLYRWTPPPPGPGRARARRAPGADRGRDRRCPSGCSASSRYAFLDDGRVVFAYPRDGLDHLAVLGTDGTHVDLDLPYTAVSSVQAEGDRVVFVGASATAEPAVVSAADRRRRAPPWPASPRSCGRPATSGIEPGWFSVPEAVSFPTSGGRTAHALFYPPTNPEAIAAAGRGAAAAGADPRRAAPPPPARCSAGHPVLDQPGVRGRRRQLRRVDRLRPGLPQPAPGRSGASSTSTTARRPPDGWPARAGSTRPGCASGAGRPAATRRWRCWRSGTRSPPAPATTASPTSRRWPPRPTSSRPATSTAWSARTPSGRDVYVARSPIHHVDGFDRPLIVLQGLEDEVVPPNQAEMIVDALRAKGVPVAYVTFPGEQHGFRAGGQHPPGARRRAVVLRPGVRLRPCRRTRGSSRSRSRTCSRGHSERALQGQEPSLGGQAAGVAGERAVGARSPGGRARRSASGLAPLAAPTARALPGRPISGARQLAVGRGLAVGDRGQRVPHRRWNAVPAGASGRSNARSSPAKYGCELVGQRRSSGPGRIGGRQAAAPGGVRARTGSR